MSTPGNPSARRIAGAVVALALSGLLAACGALAANVPALTLEIRSHPGEALGFDPSTISAPLATRVAVTFSNVSTVEHNVVFLEPLTARTKEIVRPGEVEYLEFTTPAAGDYAFVCTIHMEMTGALLVR